MEQHPESKQCPKCGLVKRFQEFGYRMIKGTPHMQSHCKVCRFKPGIQDATRVIVPDDGHGND